MLAAEIERSAHGHFNIVHTESAMRADVYLAGSDDLIAWALENRIVLQVEGEPVRFAPIEYVIAYKLQYFRMGGSDRHLRDIARIIEVSGSLIDAATLDYWLDRRNLAAEWIKAKAYVGRP